MLFRQTPRQPQIQIFVAGKLGLIEFKRQKEIGLGEQAFSGGVAGREALPVGFALHEREHGFDNGSGPVHIAVAPHDKFAPLPGDALQGRGIVQGGVCGAGGRLRVAARIGRQNVFAGGEEIEQTAGAFFGKQGRAAGRGFEAAEVYFRGRRLVEGDATAREQGGIIALCDDKGMLRAKGFEKRSAIRIVEAVQRTDEDDGNVFFPRRRADFIRLEEKRQPGRLAAGFAEQRHVTFLGDEDLIKSLPKGHVPGIAPTVDGIKGDRAGQLFHVEKLGQVAGIAVQGHVRRHALLQKGTIYFERGKRMPAMQVAFRLVARVEDRMTQLAEPRVEKGAAEDQYAHAAPVRGRENPAAPRLRSKKQAGISTWVDAKSVSGKPGRRRPGLRLFFCGARAIVCHAPTLTAQERVMIRHCVWWTMKDEAEGNNAETNARLMVERLESLRGLAGLKDMEVSLHFLPTSTEPVQILLLTTHEDVAGLRTYRTEPEHLEVVDFIRKVVTSRRCIDWEV